MSDKLLDEIYEKVYRHFCEVAPRRQDLFSSSNQVIILWNPRLRRTLGRCFATLHKVEINTIYQDPSLRHELFWLMCHETAHFIWNGHPQASKRFLRIAGVREDQ